MEISWRVAKIRKTTPRFHDGDPAARYTITVATGNGWTIPVQLTSGQLADAAVIRDTIHTAILATARAVAYETARAQHTGKD